MSLFPIFISGGPPAEVSLTANAVSSADASSYTFSSQSLGAADGSRQIIVAVASRNNAVSTLTVAGISASLIFDAGSASGGHQLEFWKAAVPTGTTGDIVVTPSSSNLGCGIAVFRALHIAAAVHDTDTDLDGSDPETNSIDIPANGILISALCGNGAGTRVTWTGVTESYDEAVDGGGNDFKHGGGSDAFSSSETGRSVTASVAGAQVTASISFGPG